MCLACQEEAFYQAYLAYMEKKKAKEAAAAEKAGNVPAVCDEAKERAIQEVGGKQ
jgi:predicted Rossmann-fold nucleotide-binding protein